MHSTAEQKGKEASAFPPQASAAAIQRIGRSRFPPAKTEYRIDLCKVFGLVVALGRQLFKAASTCLDLLLRYCLREKDLGRALLFEESGTRMF